MNINTTNNIAFSRKEKTQNTQNDKGQYYRWISQNQVYDSLKMSVGREEEDGRYKFKSMVTKGFGLLGALVSTGGAIASKFKTEDTLSKLKFNGASNEKIAETISKYDKKSKVLMGVLIGSSVLYNIGCVFESTNRKKAEKTANERGFLNSGDISNLRKIQDVYDTVEKKL